MPAWPRTTGLSRRELLAAGAATAAAGLAPHPAAPASAAPAPAPELPAFELEEMGVAELSAGLGSGRFTAVGLAEAYLGRIEQLDGQLRSLIEVNPQARELAEQSDGERRAGRVRGPLHGIPVLIKDNIATADRMETTAGSLALVGQRPTHDAFVVTRLREAGAVILGKTNLSEWANFRSSQSSSGWSGRGGQCRNPYALDRSPCGSSSGTGAAISASLATLGVGTETDGSITCPSHVCGLVGIKPTVGLVSRTGIIPISWSQDTAGPMCRTVADAATLLAVLAGEDPRDPATAALLRRPPLDFTGSLDPAGLAGARLGVARKHFFGYSPEADTVIEEALGALARSGAVLVDPADIPNADDYGDEEYEVLLYEFKAGLNAYLAALPPGQGPRTLRDLIAFNQQHADTEMKYFGQEIFLLAQKKGPLSDDAYRKAREKCIKLSRRKGLDEVLDKHRLDALVAPTGGPAWTIDLVNGDHYLGSFSQPAAVAGYPHVTVPAGFAFGLPVGLSFVGRAWSEPLLIKLAFAFEQATRHRRPPRLRPTAAL
ncbi:MAG: amidase [Thermoanaerobaculaceae bacterium]|nr:amidase [Thermoanaerobaculaceae bacterium]MDI9621060.1 amidase [Acidobacteriota bacterium]NLH12507.1 amidase [Holophagae bacterium]HPW56538.1 amidase [Thermoanaerobaculaceae bacterium]